MSAIQSFTVVENKATVVNALDGARDHIGVDLSGLAAGETGLVISPALLSFDIWVMVAVALTCLPVFVSEREFARWEGGVLLGLYAAYLTGCPAVYKSLLPGRLRTCESSRSRS